MSLKFGDPGWEPPTVKQQIVGLIIMLVAAGVMGALAYTATY